MKIISIISLALLLSACVHQEENNTSLQRYINAGIPTKGYRTFIHNSDTNQIKAFIQQSGKQINDTTLQITTYWLNVDSIPINYSVERIYANNQMQILKQSLFEPIGPGKVLELKGLYDSTIVFSPFNGNTSMMVAFNGIADTAYKMQIQANMVAKIDTFKDLNGIEVQGLTLTSNEAMQINFSDNRKDTLLHSSTTRFYTLEQGLIYFETNTSTDTLRFYLLPE